MAVGEALALFVVGVALGSVGVAILTRGGSSRRAAVPRASPAPPAASSHASGTPHLPGDRLTAAWSLSELVSAGPPTILARGLDAGPASGAPVAAGAGDAAAVPPGSRVIVTGHASPGVLRTCTVRRAAEIPLEAAVAADGRRALLFPAGIRQGALALTITDRALVARLGALAEAAWASAAPYAERRAVADLAGEPGLPVEAEGVLTEVQAREGRGLLRLEADGHVAAVRAASVAPDLLGRRVVVRGRMARDASGYPVLDADEVRPLPGSAVQPPSSAPPPPSSPPSLPPSQMRPTPPAPPDEQKQSPPAQPF